MGYINGLDMGADPITTEPSPGMMLQASPVQGRGGSFSMIFQHEEKHLWMLPDFHIKLGVGKTIF